MKHSSGKYFQKVCIATDLKEIIPCLSIEAWAKKNSSKKPHIAMQFHIAILLCSIFQ
jgi:hypothetical protein